MRLILQILQECTLDLADTPASSVSTFQAVWEGEMKLGYAAAIARIYQKISGQVKE